MPKVSIIIPVYNTDKTIKYAVRSLFDQTFTDFEVICIDDNSTDFSLKFLKDLQQEDDLNRIKIIENKKNIGPGACRNLALKHTTGEYIFYLDADDLYLDKDLIQYVVDKFEETNVDSIWFKAAYYLKGFDNYFVMSNFEEYFKLNEGYLEITPDNIGLYPSYLWTKAIKKSSITEDIFCTKNCIFEDLEFYWRYYTQNTKTYLIDREMYLHIIRDESLIEKSDYKKYAEIFKVLGNIYNYLNSTNKFEKYKKALLTRFERSVKEYTYKCETCDEKIYYKYIVEGLKNIGYPERYLEMDTLFPFYEYI